MELAENFSIFLRVIGLGVVLILSVYLMKKGSGSRFSYILSGVVALYFWAGFISVLVDVDWDSHTYLRLGWPLLIVLWIGLLLETNIRRQQ